MALTSAGIGDVTSNTEPAAAAGTPALKEWRSVCRAILEGEQIITLRKGGIREEKRHFEVRYDRFVLFPTQEHQAGDYLKPAYRRFAVAGQDAGVARSSPRASQGPAEGHGESPYAVVSIEGFCEVAGTYEITEERLLDSIDTVHIWQKAYASERLKWKPRRPLLIVVLRAYVFPAPVEIPLLEAYRGCKSWVELDSQIPMEGDPVLSDATFGAKLRNLEGALT